MINIQTILPRFGSVRLFIRALFGKMFHPNFLCNREREILFGVRRFPFTKSIPAGRAKNILTYSLLAGTIFQLPTAPIIDSVSGPTVFQAGAFLHPSASPGTLLSAHSPRCFFVSSQGLGDIH